MKYNQFAVKNQEGLYIQYPTAYNYQPKFTNSLYDAYLWSLREDAKRLSEYLMKNEGYKDLSVVEV